MRVFRTASKLAFAAALLMAANALETPDAMVALDSSSLDLGSPVAAPSPSRDLAASHAAIINSMEAQLSDHDRRVLTDLSNWLMGPPIMVQNPDTSITFSAQISFPAGYGVMYYFEFSSTSFSNPMASSYESTVPQPMMGSGSAQMVSINCGMPAGSYYYRLVVVENQGTPSQKMDYSPEQQITITVSSSMTTPFMQSAPASYPSSQHMTYRQPSVSRGGGGGGGGGGGSTVNRSHPQPPPPPPHPQPPSPAGRWAAPSRRPRAPAG